MEVNDKNTPPPTSHVVGCDDGVIASKDSLNVCRAWAELASDNERLREILRPFADVVDGISDELPDFQRVGSIRGNFGKLRLGMFRKARSALTSVGTAPPAPIEDRDRLIGNLLDRWEMTPNDLKAEMREHGCGNQLDALLQTPPPETREAGQ
jgi:hypothetical protein